MDEKLKRQAETLFEDMGMNMVTAFIIFSKAVVRQRKIPFEIAAAPFWSEENQAHLHRAVADWLFRPVSGRQSHELWLIEAD